MKPLVFSFYEFNNREKKRSDHFFGNYYFCELNSHSNSLCLLLSNNKLVERVKSSYWSSKVDRHRRWQEAQTIHGQAHLAGSRGQLARWRMESKLSVRNIKQKKTKTWIRYIHFKYIFALCQLWISTFYSPLCLGRRELGADNLSRNKTQSEMYESMYVRSRYLNCRFERFIISSPSSR